MKITRKFRRKTRKLRRKYKKRGGMTQDEQSIYKAQLKRLGKIILKRISDEVQKAKFLDVYATLDDLDKFTELENRFKSLRELLDQRTIPFGLENFIKELRQIEFNLLKDRFDKEEEEEDYYEIELAKFLVNTNKQSPEYTMPRLRPGENKQLPDTAGPIGGKKSRKSRRKRKMKGGSLVGTDIVTGLNTTDTNAALAIGTTGGTNYMLDTITAKEVSTGDYMSPDLRPVPLV